MTFVCGAGGKKRGGRERTEGLLPLMGLLTSVSVGRLVKHQHCILHLQSKHKTESASGTLTKYGTHYMFSGGGWFPL